MARLVCTEKGANKFWEASARGATLTVKWGRVGTKGQEKTKELASPAAAKASLAALSAEKLRKGYRSLAAEPAGDAARPARSKERAKTKVVPTDPNLRLAIVEALTSAGVLPPFDRRAFLAKHKIRPLLDLDDDEAGIEYTKVRPIQSALLAQLKASHYPRVERIWWGGGRTVQHLVWEQWDGEGGEFDVEDLAGISGCTSLRALELTACCSVADLSPLTGMEALEVLTCCGAAVTDVRPLRTLPRLLALDLRYDRKLADMAPVAGHPTLESIDIRHTKVTDLSFAMELPRLKALAADAGREAALARTNKGVLAALKARKVKLDVR